MAIRKTKRGAQRTALGGRYDVLICGASFAGLMVARQLAGSDAEVMILDRYEIGDRQTSACAIPSQWLEALGLEAAERQRFDSILVHTPHGCSRIRLPWTFSTFDYRNLCEELWQQCDAQFEFAKVNGRVESQNGNGDIAVGTDRGTLTAPLVVDGLGWRRILSTAGVYQPPDAPLSRGLEVHPDGGGNEMEVWIDRRYVPAGYGWSFPAADEVRVGVGSFDPRFHVRETTELLAADLERDRVRFQGNWIPHKLRQATEGGVFFVGDSAGHCLPLTAEGIRTALYFGAACGNELRAVVEGRQDRASALTRYRDFHDSHARRYRWMLGGQRLIPRLAPRLLAPLLRSMAFKPFTDWAFNRYLDVAPLRPELVTRPVQVRELSSAK